ncbi:SusC/RagA family TonB-linked outer membrane protein [Bacteroides timonensis]|uniref:SusC/RagA family TonB-linked outer membrane protein n=1 Tax=Bacteroides timonensis TaxID=1470345 RepID=UPI0004AD7901|nr:TonB-dependent receptor [Bacteroides timonensis]
MKNSKNLSLLSRLDKLQRLFLIALFSVLAMGAAAQGKTVSGTVVDQTGEPIIGANVVVKGTANGVITDQDGKFTLANVPQDATLKVSFVGYKEQSVKVADRSVIKIVLEDDMELLDEVVVIGYGSVKKGSLTNAVSKMDSKSIEDRPMARVENALQGQLAGVEVQTVTGQPGEALKIRVRGAASINASADPLYVVDGVPVSDLLGVNPNDIASIEVLKDAASAAIYGSRGNNGVVLVTTKNGKKGARKISVNFNYGIQSLEKELAVMDPVEWMEFRIKRSDMNYMAQASKHPDKTFSITDDNATRKANVGAGASFNATWDMDPRWFQYVSSATQAAHPQYSSSDPLFLMNLQDEFFKEAPVIDANVSISGGTENTTYMISGGYFDQDGLAYNTGYRRASVRAKLDTSLSKYVQVGLNLAPTYTHSWGGNANGKDAQTHKLVSQPPVGEVEAGYRYNAQGNGKYQWAGSASSPWAVMDNINKRDMMRLQGDAYLRILPMEGLKVEFTGSVNYYNRDAQGYNFTANGANWANAEGNNSSSSHATDVRWNTLLQAVVNYDKTFGEHNVGAMIGTSQEQSSIGYSTNQTYKSPFPNDNINYTFNNATSWPINASTVVQQTPRHLASFFGRLSYDYAGRYMFSGSLRRDGSSVFGANNKWGWFPAVSAGWNIANEEFWKKLGLDWWNAFKVRASYGVTGNNNIGVGVAYTSLSTASYGDYAGYAANALGNKDLKWEKAYSTDLALDLGFMNNRIQLSVDYYTKTTKDLLYSVPILGASGFTSVMKNIGQVDNSGLEIELNTQNITGEFEWSTSFNFSYNRNKVISLGGDSAIDRGFGTGSNVTNTLRVGEAINSFFLWDAIGVWKTEQEIVDYAESIGKTRNDIKIEGTKVVPGDIRLDDTNRDGNIDNSDRKILGSPTPSMVYGMTNRFSYKGFDLSVLITAQTGGKIMSILGRAIDAPGGGQNSNLMDRWSNCWWSETEQGDGVTPNPLSGRTQLSSRYLYSSDYLRIKNVTLGYNVKGISKLFSSARLFISVENLALWDKYYGGFSPEASNNGSLSGMSGSSMGLDYGGYPIARTITFGFNLNF